MWTHGVAIRPVPAHAVIEARTLDAVREAFADDDQHTQRKLDDAFERFEATQPALSACLEDALETRGLDETARTLGYFLGVAVWLAFDRQAGRCLERVEETAIRAARESLDLETELRKSVATAEAVVTHEQPALMAFIHEHTDLALATSSSDESAIHTVYRVVLIELLSLSHAVSLEPGAPARRSEVLA